MLALGISCEARTTTVIAEVIYCRESLPFSFQRKPTLPHRRSYCLRLSKKLTRFVSVAAGVSILGFVGGCGGGGGSSSGSGGDGGGGGNGGGGGSANVPSITLVSPSKIMVGVPQGGFTLYGTNFTSDVQAYVDGTVAPLTVFMSSTQLDVEISISLDLTAQVHQVKVQESAGSSNSATFTVYTPVLGPQPFSAISGYDPGGSDSGSMTVADVNGDGFADVIMPGPPGATGTPSLTVMYGQANGQLGTPIITPGLLAGTMAAGDVNGDGSVDIVSATVNASGSPVVSVLLNDGKGNFTQSSMIPYAGMYPTSMTLIDVDGDGKPDFLFSGLDPNAIYYLRNLGGGSFAAPVTIATPSADNTHFYVADFNGDGRPDIAYAFANTTTGQDEIHLLLNQGGGTFSDQVASGISGQVGYFAIGDFNRDGHMDIAIEPETLAVLPATVAVSVFFGQGNGSFVAGPTTVFDSEPFQEYQLVAGDFDGDGNLDLAGVNGDTEPGNVMFLWGDGSGNFAPQRIVGAMGFSLAAGDINGDGVPDVIIPDRFGIVSVVLGQKHRIFPSATAFFPNFSAYVSAADVNGDGKPDLLSPGAVGEAPGNLYLNQGGGQFAQAGSPSGEGLLLADLDGDGLAELIGSDGTNILIWKGTGDPNFGGPPIGINPPTNIGFDVSEMQIADMDGDGRPDIVLPGVILYNEGDLNFTAVAVNFGGASSPFVIGDFNHDGLLDLVTGNLTLLGQPNRTFLSVTPNNLNLINGDYAAVGDFNQDGNLDLVYSGNETPIEIYYGKGDGTFYQQSALNVGPTSDISEALAVGDFNGDGRPDILACLFLSEQCVVYTNDGQGGFQRSYFASGTNSIAVLATDLNGDGKPDVVVNNYNVDYAPPNFNLILHQ